MPKFRIYLEGVTEAERTVEATSFDAAALKAIEDLEADPETDKASWRAVEIKKLKDDN